MDIVKLDVQTRSGQKAKEVLAEGMIPVEFYGKGVENKSLKVDYQTFRRAFNKAGSNTIVELNVDGKETINVLIHQVDRHPVSDLMTHVDVVNVVMGQELHTQIPLEFVGTAPAVKEEGGTFMAQLSEVEVKCLPKDLIHSIEVNIESLVDFHTSIKVADLKVPDTITILNDPEDAVAGVAAPREEEAEAAPAAEEGAEGEAAAEGGDEAAAEGEKSDEAAE